MFSLSRTISLHLVFEAVVAFVEMVRALSDGSEPNGLFSINTAEPARNFGIEKVF
jgi:hypothetical protein